MARKVTKEIFLRIKNDNRSDEELIEAYKDIHLDKVVIAMIRAGAEFMRVYRDWSREIVIAEQKQLRELMDSIGKDMRPKRTKEQQEKMDAAIAEETRLMRERERERMKGQLSLVR